ncbi:MAG: hypothetical protein GQ546_02735 [Gammaproteobacteria bacterium]|nr:hypothetical protein [Gammaproteobacteria bacterium]
MKLNNYFYLLISLCLCIILSSTYAKTVSPEDCQACHPDEYRQWEGSHHDFAMQIADKNSVSGNFNQAVFYKQGVKDGIKTTFYKNNDRFMVKTDGENGKLQDFEIAYTFGVYPLQQYMVKFPKGKIQVLDIAWDSRTHEEGGQRWFSLHPDEKIMAGDVLHWTGPNMNWNYMCADCHSTNLKKNYNQSDKTYATQWDAINVSCEACHGSAADHISHATEIEQGNRNKALDKEWLNNKKLSINFPLAKQRHWQTHKETGKPRLSEKSDQYQVELCAKCHSRRSQFSDDFVPGDNFRDHYLPSLLTESLYYPDGKINDEVFVYGSFVQSKMYHSGVICSDCHNTHTLELKVPGDKVCQQCHLSSQYATATHHFHQQDSTGADCITCHMPAKTYMGVDVRNDHSFRIPRPDLSQAPGIPDACTNCHEDKSSRWAAQAIKKWYGKTPTGYQQFSPALYAIQAQTDQTLTEIYNVLLSEIPNIAKASVVNHLGDYPSQQTLMTSLQMLNSGDADIRRSALQSLSSFPIQHTLKSIFPKLEDPVKTVRLEAARILSALPEGNMGKQQKQILDKAIEEYRQSLLFISERPEAQLSLAQLYQNWGKTGQAEKAFIEALRLQKHSIPAYANYANFMQHQGRETEAYELLQQGIKVTHAASLYHALGLWFVRSKDQQKALINLQKAADMETDNARYQYVYAVAMAAKNPQQAIEILETSLQKHSGDVATLAALMNYYKQSGDQFNADKYRRKIEKVMTYKIQSK